MSQPVELDFELENEILEWSEEYNINNEALFNLITILRKRNVYQNNCSINKMIDKSTQSDLHESFPDEFLNKQNINLKEYMEDLKRTQNSILNEIIDLKKEKKYSLGTTNRTTYKIREPKKILDFPIKTFKHFQHLERICEKNNKLYKKLVQILSQNNNEGYFSVSHFLESNIKKIFDQKLIAFFGITFSEIYQLERSTIFRCLNDATLQHFSNKEDLETYKIMFNCLKKIALKKDSKIKRFYPRTVFMEENSFEIETLSINNLPCNSLEDLHKFEEQLQNDKNLENELVKLFNRGSKLSYYNFINFAMEKLFSKTITDNIAWEDKTASKTEIKKFKLMNILIGYSLENFQDVSCEDVAIQFIIQWLNETCNDTVKRKHAINEMDENLVELEIIASPHYHSKNLETSEITDDVCSYNEEFLEEEDNFVNHLPCKTDQCFRKFEEICHLDLNLQTKLKQIYQSQKSLDSLNAKEKVCDDATYMQNFSCETQINFKTFIEQNIQKILTAEVIANLPEFSNKNDESGEIINYDDILVFQILHECVKENYPSLLDRTIKYHIELFLKIIRDKFKSLIKQSEECKGKLQSEILITPDSHSIHLQSILNLPIDNFERLRDFNIKCLHDQNTALNLMSMFLQVSETDCNKFVDKNLRKLITEKMGGKLTWSGIQDNIAVKDFYIMKLLIDAAKKHFPHDGEEAIIESIKLALRRFKDRLRKRKTSIVIENLESDFDTSILNDEDEIKVDNEYLDNDIIYLKRIPCRTIEQFQKLEKYCKNCKILQENIKFLFDSNTNDKDAVKFVSENLKRIVIDSVLGHFTYNGLKNNIGVKYYSIIRILMDSLIRKIPHLSEEDAIKTLKKALLLAKDRQRSIYKKRRKENNNLGNVLLDKLNVTIYQ